MGEEVFLVKSKKIVSILFGFPLITFTLLYGGGYIAQFIRNYSIWKEGGGIPGDGSSPVIPSFSVHSSSR